MQYVAVKLEEMSKTILSVATAHGQRPTAVTRVVTSLVAIVAGDVVRDSATRLVGAVVVAFKKGGLTFRDLLKRDVNGHCHGTLFTHLVE